MKWLLIILICCLIILPMVKLITAYNIETSAIDDTYIDDDNPTNNYNSTAYLSVTIESPGYDNNNNILLRFNISGINESNTIQEAYLKMVLETNNLDAGEGMYVVVNHIYNSYSWSEATVTWNTRPNSTIPDFNTTKESNLWFFDTSATATTYIWNVTNIVQSAKNYSTVSIYVRSTNRQAIPSNLDDLRFSLHPLLNITYENNTISNTAPSININYPSNTSYSSIITQLKYIIVDDGLLSSCKWSEDNGVTNNSITCGNNITGQSWGNGSHTLTVYATDDGGLNDEDSVTFFVETLPTYSVSTGYIAPSRYTKFGYYNPYIPILLAGGTI